MHLQSKLQQCTSVRELEIWTYVASSCVHVMEMHRVTSVISSESVITWSTNAPYRLPFLAAFLTATSHILGCRCSRSFVVAAIFTSGMDCLMLVVGFLHSVPCSGCVNWDTLITHARGIQGVRMGSSVASVSVCARRRFCPCLSYQHQSSWHAVTLT